MRSPATPSASSSDGSTGRRCADPGSALWVGDGRWSTVDGFLHRHGGKAIFLGRLTAVLRALVPSMAGMSGMHYPTFLRWNAAGGILWGAGCVLLGYAFSSALATVSRYLTWAPFAAIAVVIGIVIALHARRRRKQAVEKVSMTSDSTQRAFPSVESLR